MRPITDSGPFQPITGQIRDTAPVQVNQEILIRVTGLITNIQTPLRRGLLFINARLK